MDAYTTLKFNFDGVYDVFNNIANITNAAVSKTIEAPMQKAMDTITDKLNNNKFTSGLNVIESLDQNINFNGFLQKNTLQEESGMVDYRTVYTELKQ
jgi:hypothetical protein